MGMPEIPDGKNRPSLEETIIDLFESIALEEMALSHILNAQGEHLQNINCQYISRQLSVDDYNKALSNINKMLLDVIMKEWLLVVKFSNIQDFIEDKPLNFCDTKKNNCSNRCNNYKC